MTMITFNHLFNAMRYSDIPHISEYCKKNCSDREIYLISKWDPMYRELPMKPLKNDHPLVSMYFSVTGLVSNIPITQNTMFPIKMLYAGSSMSTFLLGVQLLYEDPTHSVDVTELNQGIVDLMSRRLQIENEHSQICKKCIYAAYCFSGEVLALYSPARARLAQKKVFSTYTTYPNCARFPINPVLDIYVKKMNE